MDQSALIRRAAGSGTHGFEIGYGDRNDVAVEADNKTAEEDGIGAIAAVIGGFTVGEEVARVNAEVDEDAVGDGSVRQRGSWGGRGIDGGGEREGGGEKKKGAAWECKCNVSCGATVQMVMWR